MVDRVTPGEEGVTVLASARLTALCVQRLHIAPADAAAIVSLMVVAKEGASLVEQQQVFYLPLASVVARLSSDRAYLAALPYGRALYRDEQCEQDETTGQVFKAPIRYRSYEVLHIVRGFLYLDDVRLQLTLPLAWRTGLAVGWLSGLWVSQPDDAANGMTMLAGFVSRLVYPAPAPVVPSLPNDVMYGDDDDFTRVFDRCTRDLAPAAPGVGQSSKLVAAPSPAVPAPSSSSATPRPGRLSRRYRM